MVPVKAEGEDEYTKRFKELMDDDFNTPGAMAVLFDLAKAVNKEEGETKAKLAGRLVELGSVLGILYQNPSSFLKGAESSDNDEVSVIEALIQERKDARARKDFKAADAARDKLTAMGIVLEDGPSGTTWRRK